MIGPASWPSHCSSSEQYMPRKSLVTRRLSLLVEVGEAGEFADHLALGLGADHEGAAGGAVVGPGRAVLLRPAPELAPHLDQDAVGEAARFEVALEGEQPSQVSLRLRFEVSAWPAWVS